MSIWRSRQAEQVFQWAVKGGTDPRTEFGGGEQPVGFDHAALPVHPLRLSEPILLHLLSRGVNTCWLG